MTEKTRAELTLDIKIEVCTSFELDQSNSSGIYWVPRLVLGPGANDSESLIWRNIQSRREND